MLYFWKVYSILSRIVLFILFSYAYEEKTPNKPFQCLPLFGTFCQGAVRRRAWSNQKGSPKFSFGLFHHKIRGERESRENTKIWQSLNSIDCCSAIRVAILIQFEMSAKAKPSACRLLLTLNLSNSAKYFCLPTIHSLLGILKCFCTETILLRDHSLRFIYSNTVFV